LTFELKYKLFGKIYSLDYFDWIPQNVFQQKNCAQKSNPLNTNKNQLQSFYKYYKIAWKFLTVTEDISTKHLQVIYLIISYWILKETKKIKLSSEFDESFPALEMIVIIRMIKKKRNVKAIATVQRIFRGFERGLIFPNPRVLFFFSFGSKRSSKKWNWDISTFMHWFSTINLKRKMQKKENTSSKGTLLLSFFISTISQRFPKSLWVFLGRQMVVDKNDNLNYDLKNSSVFFFCRSFLSTAVNMGGIGFSKKRCSVNLGLFLLHYEDHP